MNGRIKDALIRPKIDARTDNTARRLQGIQSIEIYTIIENLKKDAHLRGSVIKIENYIKTLESVIAELEEKKQF